MIVINPWYVGVSFDRYYHGAAAWNTVPPISSHALHRYDLVKDAMTVSSPIDPLLRTISDTLKGGHRVWIVGALPLQDTGQPPPGLAPAPYDPVGWSEAAYTMEWATEVGYFIQAHASKGESLNPLTKQPVNSFEDISLLVLEGWQVPEEQRSAPSVWPSPE